MSEPRYIRWPEIAERLGYENAASVKSAIASVWRDYRKSEGTT